MGCRLPLCHTEMFFSLPSFRRSFMRSWVPGYILVLHISTDRRKRREDYSNGRGSLLTLVGVGISIFRWLSFLLTTTIMAALAYLPLSFYMGGSAVLLFVGSRSAKESWGSMKIVLKMKKLIKQVRQRLLTAYSRQKSYANRRRSELEFQVGDLVLLKVSPWKGVTHFRK